MITERDLEDFCQTLYAKATDIKTMATILEKTATSQIQQLEVLKESQRLIGFVECYLLAIDQLRLLGRKL